MTRKKVIVNILLVCVLICALQVLSGCSKKQENEVKPTSQALPSPTLKVTDNPVVTQEPTAVPTLQEENNPTPSQETSVPTEALEATEVPVMSGEEDMDETADETADETDTILPGIMEDDVHVDIDSETPEPTQAPKVTPTAAFTEPEKEDNRAQLWDDTFLIWIPQFTDGKLLEHQAADTFDYAYFEGVNTAEVYAYISLLEQSGFVSKVDTGEKEGRIWYSAVNVDDWTAVLEYENGILRLGSGYVIEVKDNVSKTDELWATTELGNLPKFETGVFESGAGKSGSTDAYVIFSSVDIESIRNYIEALRNAGFSAEEDFGDEDGFIWFTALNEAGLSCDLTYYDRVVKISCFQ